MLTAALLGPGCADVTPDATPDATTAEADGRTGYAMIRTTAGVQRVPYVVSRGRAIYAGDIDLGPVEKVERSLYGGAVHSVMATRWPGGVFTYCIDGEVSADNRTDIRAVMSTLAAETPIRPREYECDEVPSREFTMYVQDDDVAPEEVGSGEASRIGFPQPLETGITFITLDGDVEQDVIAHETLHALGFFHEQARPDRDRWVSINTSCVDSSKTGNYAIADDARALGPYDFDSIMHYATGEFCKTPMPSTCRMTWDLDNDGMVDAPAEVFCSTMTRRTTGGPVFRNVLLSREDRNMLWRMHPTALPDADYDRMGTSVAVGDFDGDGYDDVAVGAPGRDVNGARNAGSVFLYRGTSNRMVPWREITQTTVGFANEADDNFGQALAAGDIDRDGRDELVIGIPLEDVGSVVDSGAVVVMRGSPAGLSPWRTYSQSSRRSGTLASEGEGDHFGAAVLVADLAGADMERLVVVGAPNEVNGSVATGAVFMFGYDSIGRELATRVASPYAQRGAFGAALATGQLDAHSFQDLVVGAPGVGAGKGAVVAYAGVRPSFNVTNPSPVVVRQYLSAPDTATGAFGAALAVGPLRGTFGSPDEIVVGAPTTSSMTGAAYIYAGSLNDTSFALAQAFRPTPSANLSPMEFGTALALGNVDPTTPQAELVVGAPGDHSNAGSVRIYRGNTGDATISQFRENDDLPGGDMLPGERFGAALAIGQLDGTGDQGSTEDWRVSANFIADLVITHPYESHEFNSEGAFSVFRGAGSGPFPTRTYDRGIPVRD